MPFQVRGGKILIVPLLLLSAFLQFYELDTQQLFLGDQGLHAQVAHDIVVLGARPLVGPPLAALSGTNMGPIFYYLSALPVWLTGGWPTGGAALVGAFQVATVYMLYRLGRITCGTAFGLTAALLYATSGVVVYWHRMLWPNMVPFCIVLSLWMLVIIARRQESQQEGWAFVVLIVAMAMAVQLQPTAFLLLPVVVGSWFLARPRRPAWWAIGVAVGLTTILFFPLIVNEVTTDFSQTHAWIGYLRQTRQAIGGLRDTIVLTGREYRGLIGIDNALVLSVLAAVSLVAVVAAALPTIIQDKTARWISARIGVTIRGQVPRQGRLLARFALLWGGVYAIALALGHQQIYPHYYIPLFPLPFLALSFVVALLWRHRWTAALALGLVVGLAGWNIHTIWANQFGLDRTALLDPSDVQTPNLTLGTLRDVTRVIALQSGSTPYNFELLSPSDYPVDYKYLLRLQGTPPNHLPVSRKVVVVQPAYLSPASWPAWVAQDLATTMPRFWLFQHVALWSWDNRIPLSGQAQSIAQGEENSARLVTVLAVGPHGQMWRGSPAGIAVSIDRGLIWGRPVSVRGDSTPDQPEALLVDPAKPERVYAATATGLYSSDDRGRTWSRVQRCPGRTFALAAPSLRIRLAGNENGLCVSQDGGKTWRQQILVTSSATADWEKAHPQPVYTFWQDPSGAILAGAGYGLIASADGLHWHHVAGLDAGITSLAAIYPGRRLSQGQHTIRTDLYAGTAAGVFRSTTDGRNWHALTAGMSAPYIFGLAATQTRAGSVLWAATAAGLFRLEQGETSWSVVTGGWPSDTAALSLLIDGQDIYVGTDSGLYGSADGGLTWTQH